MREKLGYIFVILKWNWCWDISVCVYVCLIMAWWIRVRGAWRWTTSRLAVSNSTSWLQVIRLFDFESWHDLVVADDFLFANDIVALLDLNFGHYFNTFGCVACWFTVAVRFTAAWWFATVWSAHFCFVSGLSFGFESKKEENFLSFLFCFVLFYEKIRCRFESIFIELKYKNFCIEGV